jgi:hypothetical protein
MKPWTVALDLATTPNYQIYEYACHEGNYGLANILSAARAEERDSWQIGQLWPYDQHTHVFS